MPRGVFVRTQEYRQKMRDAMARRENPGRNKTEETKKKIGLSQKGKPESDEFKKKCSERMAGKPGFFRGKTHTREWVEEMKNRLLGENHWNWKRGVTPINSAIRGSKEYIEWRNAVFARDNYTCVGCGKRGNGNLNADHIKPFSLYPELRFDLDNGRTLCVDCHKKTDTYGAKLRKRTA